MNLSFEHKVALVTGAGERGALQGVGADGAKVGQSGVLFELAQLMIAIMVTKELFSKRDSSK